MGRNVYPQDRSDSLNVLDFGAVGNGIRLHNITATTGSPIVTCATASFMAADIGKLAVVYNNAAAGTITTIQSVESSTSVTLAANAGLTTSGATSYMIYGTDDSAAFNLMFAAATSAAAGIDTTVGDNQPQGLSQTSTVAPSTYSGGMYIIGSQLTISPGGDFDAQSKLCNLLADRYAPMLVAQQYTRIRHLEIEAVFGTGIQLGTATGVQQDIVMDDFTAWHVGTAVESTGLLRSQDGLSLLGYNYLLHRVWIKGGSRAIFHNHGSDCVVNYAYCIGAKTGVHLNAANQVQYNNIFLDTCSGNGAPYGGVVVDNGCTNVYARVHAYETIGTSSTVSPVVAVGQINTPTNIDIVMDVMANNTGGVGLAVNHAQECHFECNFSNSQFTTGASNPITTAVAFGANLAGAVTIDATLAGGITPYSGTLYIGYVYHQSGVKRVTYPFATSDRTYISAAATAPTDGNLAISQITPYLDEAGNNLKFRVRYSDGSYKTATVAVA
jgi:hypothetical protein